MNTLPISGTGSASFDAGVPAIRRAMRAACLALGFVLSSSVAFAEPVTFVTGSVFTGNYDTGFHLFGPNVTLHANQWLEPIVNCAPCTPGASLDLSTTLTVRDWAAGNATIDGQTYDSVFFSGAFDFDADSVIVPDMAPGQSGPDAQGLTRIFGSRFLFTGTLAGFADPSLTGTPLFSTDLRGGGIIMAAFSNYPPETGIRVLQLDYHLTNDPVPEPGSLLLVGSGAAWLAARWRRRRQAGV